MADHAHAHAAHAPHGDHAHAHPPINYIRIWFVLVLLLIVSVAGPMLGHQWITLVTAFGIACVKAYLVAKNFMHINLEQRFVAYVVITVLVFMLLFFAGAAPDVMKDEGSGWVKPAWKAAASAANAPEGGAAHH
jgi:caa(3)-type oxidase subunit IV